MGLTSWFQATILPFNRLSLTSWFGVQREIWRVVFFSTSLVGALQPLREFWGLGEHEVAENLLSDSCISVTIPNMLEERHHKWNLDRSLGDGKYFLGGSCRFSDPRRCEEPVSMCTWRSFKLSVKLNIEKYWLSGRAMSRGSGFVRYRFLLSTWRSCSKASSTEISLG